MSRRRIARIVLAALAVAVALAGMTGDTTCGLAQSPSCRSTCLSQYNHCRLTTKGAPSCDSLYQACLQSCLATR